MIVKLEQLIPTYNPLDRGSHRIDFLNRIVVDIKKNGIINPLICIAKDDKFLVVIDI